MDPYRSGEYSLDPTFDVDELVKPVDSAASRAAIVEAFTKHLAHAEPDVVAHAIAVYVRASRQRGHQIEHVISHLELIQTQLEGVRAQALSSDAPSALRQAILRGILLAFYGANVVAEEDSKREARRARRKPAR